MPGVHIDPTLFKDLVGIPYETLFETGWLSRPLKRALNDKSGKCWYTGIECHFYKVEHLHYSKVTDDPWYASIEHLVPLALCRDEGVSSKHIQGNRVIAARFINNIIGSPPLSIKMQLKDELKKIQFLPNIDKRMKAYVYSKFTKAFLDQFKIDGIKLAPWQWRGATTLEAKDALYIRYKQLCNG